MESAKMAKGIMHGLREARTKEQVERQVAKADVYAKLAIAEAIAELAQQVKYTSGKA